MNRPSGQPETSGAAGIVSEDVPCTQKPNTSTPLSTDTSVEGSQTTIGGQVDKSGESVRRMFAQIAPKYDFLNHLLSLNIDRSWRKKTLRLLKLSAGRPVLDVCTGTGDLAIAIARQLGSDTRVVGTDFCPEMLEIARVKQQKMHLGSHDLNFVEADTQTLPFADDEFQCVTVAFGLRNVANTQAGLREMLRVTKPGGQIAVLEFSKPTIGVLRLIYESYFLHVLPRIGQSIARNDKSAYEYLPQSVQQFPSGRELADILESSGIQKVQIHPMTLGIVTLYAGLKP